MLLILSILWAVNTAIQTDKWETKAIQWEEEIEAIAKEKKE